MRRRIVLIGALLAAAVFVLYDWYVLGAGIRPRIEDAPGLRWEIKAPLPRARTEVTAALWRGRIVVIGGLDGLARTTPTVQIYDPARDAWEIGPDSPHIVHHAMAASLGDRLFLMGGLAGLRFAPTRRAFVFDGTWREVAPLPEPLGASGIAVLDGRIHVVSGQGRSGNTPVHYAYDPALDHWVRLADVPTARDHLAAAALGGRLYATGGRVEGGIGRGLNRVDIYDPSTDRWAPGPPLVTSRSGHVAATLGRRTFVFGGERPGGTIAAAEAFDGTAWVVVTRMPTARHGLGVAAVEKTIYLLSGGKRPALSVSRANEALTVAPVR